MSRSLEGAWGGLMLAALSACGGAGRPPTGADATTPEVSADARDDRPDTGDRATDAEPEIAEDAATGPDRPPAMNGFDAERWRRSTIYFVMTDRFSDGDPTNNGGPDCFDPASPTLFHGGDLAGLRARLDYLEELGVDTVWLTPVSAQVPRRGGSCGYHGYWADLTDPDEGAIEPHLGTDAELSGLIDDLHGRGMKLIIDLVVNHSGRGARIVDLHPDWFHPQDGCGSLGPSEIFCPLSGLPDFAQERPEVADYLDAMSADWMRRFAFDGIRMDTAKHVPAEYFADRFIPTVLRERPGLYLVGEIFDEGSYALQVRYRAAGFHGFFDFPLRRALIDGFARGGSLRPIADRVREAAQAFGPEGALLRSTFLDNHDVGRFTREIPRDLPPEVREARYLLALSLLFTAPGIPQIYAGDELGAEDADNRRDMPAWAFDPPSRRVPHEGFLPGAERIFNATRALIALRREIPALHRGGYAELWHPSPTDNVYAFHRSDGSSQAIVAFNGGDAPVASLRIGLVRNNQITARDKDAIARGPSSARLQTAGATLTVDRGELLLSLPPRTVEVWSVP